MKSRAYAVALIKPGTPSTVIGAGIFGEPTPTTMGLIPVELFHEEADDFAAAVARAGDILRSNYYDWCGPLRVDPARGVYRDAREVTP